MQPEKNIPIIQARRQLAYIASEQRSLNKWRHRHQNAIAEEQLEREQYYGPKKHPTDIRLEAEEAPAFGDGARKTFLKSNQAWTSDPDAARYYGFGIAPPGTKRDEHLQIARGAYDGKFKPSINAAQRPSKFGKLTSEKRWMDYSGVRIFGKGHKDPLANDYTKFRSTPRGERGKEIPKEFAPLPYDSDDEDGLSTVETVNGDDAVSVMSSVSQPSKRSSSSLQRGARRKPKNRPQTSANRSPAAFKSRKGALLDKYTDKTFGVSPLTTRMPLNATAVGNEYSQDQRPQTSAALSNVSLQSSTFKKQGRWKVKRAKSALSSRRNGNADVSRSDRLANLLAARRRRFMEQQDGKAASQVGVGSAVSGQSRRSNVTKVTPRVERSSSGRWVVKYSRKNGGNSVKPEPQMRSRPSTSLSRRSGAARGSDVSGRRSRQSRVSESKTAVRGGAASSICTDGSW